MNTIFVFLLSYECLKSVYYNCSNTENLNENSSNYKLEERNNKVEDLDDKETQYGDDQKQNANFLPTRSEDTAENTPKHLLNSENSSQMGFFKKVLECGGSVAGYLRKHTQNFYQKIQNVSSLGTDFIEISIQSYFPHILSGIEVLLNLLESIFRFVRKVTKMRIKELVAQRKRKNYYSQSDIERQIEIAKLYWAQRKIDERAHNFYQRILSDAPLTDPEDLIAEIKGE